MVEEIIAYLPVNFLHPKVLQWYKLAEANKQASMKFVVPMYDYALSRLPDHRCKLLKKYENDLRSRIPVSEYKVEADISLKRNRYVKPGDPEFKSHIVRVASFVNLLSVLCNYSKNRYAMQLSIGKDLFRP